MLVCIDPQFVCAFACVLICVVLVSTSVCSYFVMGCLGVCSCVGVCCYVIVCVDGCILLFLMAAVLVLDQVYWTALTLD